MVLKRKLDYGPNSLGFSVIPRGPRSARRKISHKDNIEDNGICAFELLAAVAGKLLQESESSASSNVAVEKDPFLEKLFQVRENSFGKGKLEVDKTPECPDRGSCVESSSRSGLPAKKTNSKIISRKLIQNGSDTVLETGSIISASNVFNKDGDKVKFEIPDMKDCVKNGGSSPNCGESSSGYVDNSIETKLESKGGGKFDHYADLVGTNTSNDKLKINVNYYPLIKTDSSVKLASFRDSLPNDSFLSRRKNVNVSIRDDDENFIRCNRCKPKIKAFRPRSCIGYRRVRKLSTSKYWKVAPKLKDCEFSNSERGMKRIFYNRKYYNTSEKIRREGSFKKRKLFDVSLKHASDREGSSESISNTREKGIKGEKIGVLKSRKEHGISSPFVGQGSPYKSMDSHVKFSIKSFKVPELYIEVPETATVGSLKRTVMEAVTAILQEGLRVGVILQGEKVKDDERTLLQSGISHNGNLDNLGFSLEPTPIIVPPPVSPEVPITLLPCETAQPLTRFVADTVLELGKTSASADPIQVADTETNIISNNELVPFNTEIVTNEEVPDSRALVPLPEASIEALSIIPTNQKTKKTEMAQRRTRRPFSVTEVEALVEAVETLGTGRWRDVKLHAFESADHRTYVDLKDKWKTLVHTASISPQQRRGQPVPQDLLDRVLGAHSYWSQHQSKQQHNKNQAELATA